MFENMVCGVANVGERKYRILAVFIIAVMVSMSAFLMPVQVYAAGEAISVLVGTLAGLITESVAGSALAAAGCAALIPEFAGALIAVAVGLGVTLTVYQLYQCFQSWWGTSGNVSDFKMVAGSYDSTLHKVVATPFVFSLIASLIKEKILGISESSSDTSTLPALSKLTEVGSVSEPCKTFYDKSIRPTVNSKFSDKLSFSDSWKIVDGSTYNRAQHYVKIFSDDNNFIELVSAQAQLDMDLNYAAGINVGAPGTLKFTSYLPIIQKNKILIGGKIIQVSDKGTRKALEEVVAPASINFKVGGTYAENVTCIDGKVYDRYSGQRLVKLKYKDGTVRDSNFSSINEFIYELLYKATQYCNRYGEWNTIGFSSLSLSEPVVRPNITANYNSKRDVISTTADDINKKIKTGDVTKDTAGSISIGMTPTAVGKLTNTTTAQDVEKVKITDVALPTQVEADKTAKEEAKIDPPGNIGAAFRQGGDMIIDGAMTISDKFPFDVIKCAYEWLQCLIQDGKPIVTEFTIKIPKIGSVPVKIDFSQRQDVVTVINWICIVGCGLGLILTSREWLKAI